MQVNVEDKKIQSKNPRTGRPVGVFESTDPGEIPAITQSARRAQAQWAELEIEQRLRVFRRAYREFYLSRDEIAELISSETGKPLPEAHASEILPVLDCFKYYIRNMRRFLRPEKIRAQNPLFRLRKGFVLYEPLGVVAVISPWNFPCLLSMQHIVPALLSGNAVIHKPSEFTTLVSLKIHEVFDRAQLPAGLLSVVAGFADVGQALVAQPLDKIFFTGSTRVGKQIYGAAAANLTGVNMELGGSDAMVVLEDADLERTVSAALWGAFSNAGQACVSVERMLVQESIFDLFIEKFVAGANDLKVANSGGHDPDVCCLINESQFRKIDALVQEIRGKGAVVQFGGKARHDLGDLCYSPTILSLQGAAVKMRDREIFGPVVLLQRFSTDDEAVALANDSDFGLSGSVWSRNRRRALQLAGRIQSGSVLINEVQSHIAQFEAPYTGWKQSGLGVSHGRQGMLEMVRTKYVSVDRAPVQALLAVLAPRLARRDVWWFPYDKKSVNDFRSFSAFLHAPSWAGKLRAVPGALKALWRKRGK